jgi:hypothetical protein
MSKCSSFGILAKLPGVRQHVNRYLLPGLQPKTYRWPYPPADAHHALALRLGALALSGISCLLGVRLLNDTNLFKSDCTRSVLFLLSRCSSATVPLRRLRAQQATFSAALVQREGIMQAALSAANDAARSTDRVVQAQAMVERKKIIAAQAAADVLAAEVDLVALREAENVAKQHYEQLSAAVDAVNWRLLPIDQCASCVHGGSNHAQDRA